MKKLIFNTLLLAFLLTGIARAQIINPPGGSGTVNSGNQGATAYFAANGTAVNGTTDYIKAAAFSFATGGGGAPAANDTALACFRRWRRIINRRFFRLVPINLRLLMG
jgi:hypothetical protein